MRSEDAMSCIQDIDSLLSEIESAVYCKDYCCVMRKLRAARETIEELREEDYADDNQRIEFKMLKLLK